ncbi:putative 6-phosphofructo-2-kinase PB17E12.14c [Glarea lozoyensis 74030]|uniref:Putative 6-phosphofructo-2-kinase PB17E12.14c n=1 Tax=Glarea lozoyensis (strain ATCC 74030 / MF5533) TaxID=1104152 RepID=H0EF17_GLAL7|nr:putative 6-phosphofructo-2-kinase PB17E12.14c [Glarea lozoyensis 74030]
MPTAIATGEGDTTSLTVLVARQGAKLMSTSALPPPAIEDVAENAKQVQLEKDKPVASKDTLLAPPKSSLGRALQAVAMGSQNHGPAMNDTPLPSAPSTAPGSPRLFPVRQNSGTVTPRVRPPATTLNIPGMTRSRVSPNGKIASRDVGAKLVIIMVGLPARGKSYITKKLQRYLSWQQHESKIFNVGNRRRVAAGSTQGPVSPPQNSPPGSPKRSDTTRSIGAAMDAPTQAAHILLNGVDPTQEQNELTKLPSAEGMDQSASFFDPKNSKAAQLREQVAMSTLDELLDFLLNQGGSVGILDATNSTVERRQVLFNRVKEREPKLGIIFIESVCQDQKLLEANMRLKLRGPDYKDKDPESALADFKKRVEAYESAYVPLGQYEEDQNMQYIQMIDVGRKLVHHQLQGFLTSGIASYLSTFNLSPRQIWITRHGQSVDNHLGKLGGDSDITQAGRNYGTVLYNFISKKRTEWEVDQKSRALAAQEFLGPGDRTPPYPELLGDLDSKNFCVWTSMLQRSIQTAQDFEDDENYDVKNWEMLNEIHAGKFEGMTYGDIQQNFPEEFAKRAEDKLNYVYPGVGGEGYLQVISRLRDMVRELERIKDHVLIIGHRSVARVLMAYFMDFTRDDIADLDVPLGLLFSIEPKPYGIEFHAYKYNDEEFWFDELVGYKPQKETVKGN